MHETSSAHPTTNTPTTPLMLQYHDIKSNYKDALLLFQVGDFYELFFDDAKRAAAYLGIVLTSRGKDKGEAIPLCGIPRHALDYYLTKLIKGGFNVAVCDQLEEPVPGRVVRRGVTQVLTPGTLTDSKLLDDKSASYLLAFFPQADAWALVFGELLTAQLFATTIPAGSERQLESEIARFFPDEIVVPDASDTKSVLSYLKKLGYCVTPVAPSAIGDEERDARTWAESLHVKNAQTSSASYEQQLALRYFYAYLKRNQEQALTQSWQLNTYAPDDFLILDAATQRNLELVKNNQDGTSKHTLFDVLDRAVTPMGSRMIKKWLLRPLIKKEAITQRLHAVELLVHDVMSMQQLEEHLQSVGDLERVVGRIALGRAQLHDYCALRYALEKLPDIIAIVDAKKAHSLYGVIRQHMDTFDALQQLLAASCNTDVHNARLIASGFDAQLDEVRLLVEDSQRKLLELERCEQQRTGITSLRVGFHQSQGYFFEVTKANLHLIPDDYIRHQTLVGKERFVSRTLQELQSEIIMARSRIDQLEKEVFERVKKEVASYTGLLRRCSHAIAHLDALLGFARAAYERGYVRPTFNDERNIIIKAGRHPVVETKMQGSFISNDVHLTDDASLWIVTGPNMGGKSTFLRQVALLSIMAQSGSFVPATSANLPLLDRIFTRIGAGDNMAEGKSTFLVEMEETATICTQATRNSLVILDEVGRGTSTFDGLAIAQAVVEYLYKEVGARALFATHYHELTALQGLYPGMVSYYAASRKRGDDIVFLYKIVQGVADGSFGVQVARLAQLPQAIITRAQHLLTELTKQESGWASHTIKAGVPTKEDTECVRCACLERELKTVQHESTSQADLQERLKGLSFDDLSPKKALDLLWQLKEEGIL